MAKETKRETFELLYSRLEETVGKLEQGGLPLEQAIALYEEGMAIAKQCQDQLEQAELKITRLRESFAVLPARANGAVLQDAPDGDYEYVADDENLDEKDPFT